MPRPLHVDYRPIQARRKAATAKDSKTAELL